MYVYFVHVFWVILCQVTFWAIIDRLSLYWKNLYDEFHTVFICSDNL